MSAPTVRSRRRGHFWLRLLGLLALVAVTAAACGGGEAEPEAEAEPTPAVSDDGNEADDGNGDAGSDGDDSSADSGGSADDGSASDDGSADGSVDGSGEADCSQATASDVGVTEDTITIGLISVDLTGLFGTGLVPELTPEHFFSRTFALIHAINEAGGVNCRQIEIVQETYDPARSAETQVPACERLAQDNEVFAVIAAFPDSAGGGQGCIWDRFGLPLVTTGPISESTLAEAGGLIVSNRASVEVMTNTAIQAYLDLGLFDGEKVAVLGGDSGELRTARVLAVERLEAEGVDVVDVELPSSGGAVAVWGVLPQVGASLVEQDVTTVVMTGSNVTMRNLHNEMVNNGADWQWLTIDTQGAGGQATVAGMPDGWRAVAATSILHEPRTDAGDLECIEATELMRTDGRWGPEFFEDIRWETGNTNTTRPLSDDCALAKIMVVGLQEAGLNPTRASFVEGLNGAGAIDVGFETDGVLTPGKGYVSDSMRIYQAYPPGSQECIDLGYFPELACFGPYQGDDPGEIPNVTG